MSLNLRKRREHKYLTAEEAKKVRNPGLIDSMTALTGEYETNLTEMVKKRKVINDNVPGMKFVENFSLNFFLVHIGFFILENSKLHILRCIRMFCEFFDTDAMTLLYMDTGELNFDCKKRGFKFFVQTVSFSGSPDLWTIW